MKVETRGQGEPEHVVVGLIHGDEPCGKKAIEKFLSENREFKKPVKFIIANEEAHEENKRFLEADLNRSFPGDLDSDLHEERLAAKVLKEVQGRKVLDLHSTRSHKGPFATLSTIDGLTVRFCRAAGAENAVHFPQESGAMTERVDGIVLETGYQGTEGAAERSYRALVNFLAAEGIIDDGHELSDPDFFRYQETVEGDWEFTAQNFKKVEKGEVFAKRGDEELVAEEDFYPVLMSTDGYEGQLGFKAEKVEVDAK